MLIDVFPPATSSPQGGLIADLLTVDSDVALRFLMKLPADDNSPSIFPTAIRSAETAELLRKLLRVPVEANTEAARRLILSPGDRGVWASVCPETQTIHWVVFRVRSTTGEFLADHQGF